jgi:hypothetical protein
MEVNVNDCKNRRLRVSIGTEYNNFVYFDCNNAISAASIDGLSIRNCSVV